MKKILFLLSVVMITMTSCLKHDLDEVESSKLCDISNVEFEYRWTEEIIGSNGNPTGVHELHYKGIEVTRIKDEANHKISLEMKVPMPSGDFTLERRQQVSLQNLVGMFTVSTAASVTPLNGAPALGKKGDFSRKSFTYRVTAPSGDYIDWEIEITKFDDGIAITKMEWNDEYDTKIVSGSVGEQKQLTVGLTPEIATNKTLKWEIENEAIATVTQEGLVTLVSAGYTTLKVSATDGSGLFLERRIAVDFVPVSTIEFEKALIAMDMQGNKTVVISAPAILPAEAMIKELIWKVDDEGVVTFDPETLTLTAVAPGTTKLTATATDGFEAQAIATIIVTEEPAEEPEPYVYIGAAEFTNASNINTTPKNTSDNLMKTEIPYQIESIAKGAYMAFEDNPVLMLYYNYITFRASTEKKAQGVVTVRLDAADGPVVATIKLDATGTWNSFKSYTAPLDLSKVNLSKKHTLYLSFSNTNNEHWICNFHFVKLGVDDK